MGTRDSPRDSQVPRNTYSVISAGNCNAHQTRNFIGSFRSSADVKDELDLEVGTLISSEDSLTEKITLKMQPSVTVAFCHCTRLAQSVKTSDELVVTPLCGLPATQKSMSTHWGLTLLAEQRPGTVKSHAVLIHLAMLAVPYHAG